MKLFALFLFIAVISFLMIKLGRKSGPSKYDRKPSTPWNSLSEGEDPTI